MTGVARVEEPKEDLGSVTGAARVEEPKEDLGSVTGMATVEADAAVNEYLSGLLR